MSEAIRRVLDAELAANPRVLVFGEDVGPRGGVHRVTLGLQAEHGEARVFDTSLSEEGIMGRAQGLALAGLRPVPEIQFRKYADPAYEQMHDIGWVRWRTAGKFSAPIVVRMPFGFSRKTGDPWHSVSDEAVYAHMPGWRIAVPSNAEDAAGLLREALRGDDPTVILEHRALYDAPVGRRPYPGDDSSTRPSSSGPLDRSTSSTSARVRCSTRSRPSSKRFATVVRRRCRSGRRLPPTNWSTRSTRRPTATAPPRFLEPLSHEAGTPTTRSDRVRPMSAFHDLEMRSITGDQVAFEQFRGQICLVVNVASL
jgi:hypothetical protein